jgi:integrative and conjugative element protein (TIGR02256 family)
MKPLQGCEKLAKGQPPRRARSADGRFNLELPGPVIDEMLEHCALSYPLETGGILVGHYSDDSRFAHVTDLVSAPRDSVSSRFSFQRGVRGVQKFLNQMWPRRRYYLGEWHFHPDGSASPSGTDANQMRSIAYAGSYHCPEPVLLILGGNPPEQFTLESYVFLRGTSDVVALGPEPPDNQRELP